MIIEFNNLINQLVDSNIEFQTGMTEQQLINEQDCWYDEVERNAEDLHFEFQEL